MDLANDGLSEVGDIDFHLSKKGNIKVINDTDMNVVGNNALQDSQSRGRSNICDVRESQINDNRENIKVMNSQLCYFANFLPNLP